MDQKVKEGNLFLLKQGIDQWVDWLEIMKWWLWDEWVKAHKN